MTDGLNFIGGTWVPAVSGQTFTRRNPADPTDVVGTFPASGPRDVATAIDHLDKAAPDWAATSPERRAAVLELLVVPSFSQNVVVPSPPRS